MKSPSEKAAEQIVKALNRVDLYPTLIAGELMEQPYSIQRRVTDTFVIYLQMQRDRARNPVMEYSVDPHVARMVESIDLTDFDH